ncbi:Peroxiredoxin [bacterium A37T11]|nr:Peroxiredoxin [bacterium A37T11]
MKILIKLNIVLLSLWIPVIGRAQHSMKNHFVIKGTLDKDQTDIASVVLKFMDESKNTGPQISGVVSGGKYTLSGNLDEPALVNIIPKYKEGKNRNKWDDDILMAYIEPGIMKIIHKKTFSKIELTGSQAQKDYLKLQSKISQVTDLENDAEMRGVYENFAKENPKSPIIIYVLSNIVNSDGQVLYDIVMPIFNQLPLYVQHSNAGRGFLEDVERGKVYLLEQTYRKNMTDSVLSNFYGSEKDSLKKYENIVSSELIYSIQEMAWYEYLTTSKRNELRRELTVAYLMIASDSSRLWQVYRALPDSLKVPKLKEIFNKVRKTCVDKLAPEFTQRDTSGRSIALSTLRGNYVLIDFWASWCGPCRKENPNLLEQYKKYHAAGFEILGVSLDKNKSLWEKAIRDDWMNWVQVTDLKYWENEAANLYSINGIPQNFLISPEGKIVARNLFGGVLRRKLAELYTNK